MTKHKHNAIELVYFNLTLDNDVFMTFHGVEVRMEYERESSCCVLEVLTYRNDDENSVASSMWIDTDRIKRIMVGSWEHNKIKVQCIWPWENEGEAAW